MPSRKDISLRRIIQLLVVSALTATTVVAFAGAGQAQTGTGDLAAEPRVPQVEVDRRRGLGVVFDDEDAARTRHPTILAPGS